jgi:type IV fimbrial biogenesis protein FimT
MPRYIACGRGFTIIEQLIAIVVTSIVLALGLPNYSDFVQNRHIRTQANAIVDGLQVARLEAVRRNEPVEFRMDGAAWAVVVPASGEVVHTRTNAETPNARPALSDGGPAIAVAFNGVGRITSGNAATVIAIGHASGSCGPTGYRCMRVQMSAGGQVRMCDPQLGAGDPQACA